MASQITTLTFFKYKKLTDQIWAFGMMQFAHSSLRKTEGLTFYKLLGTGREGFDPKPDWSVYALLQVWESEEKADVFFQHSSLIKKYRKHSHENWTLYLRNKIARGKWAGSNPFSVYPELTEKIPYVVAITRATIKFKYLRRFWKSVPASQNPLRGNSNLIYTKGIGELPFMQMATFSLWENQQALDEFAYRSKEHIKVIGDTRTLGWYKEELFSRFQPYRSLGCWEGRNPLIFKESDLN
ncbi:DUF3291 domain-containing protein [Muriicola soli]|uniref:DUF3291 domain-containing protein n=1 Tax=Muriicola soli TaxID=2507538 RepID=A0A411E850_9FLAO|nr:DUF3291 domain-containing protein [Muriicola soli]QBA63630.1 DUF3291 domain-containing protein [Muriicola soli]